MEHWNRNAANGLEWIEMDWNDDARDCQRAVWWLFRRYFRIGWTRNRKWPFSQPILHPTFKSSFISFYALLLPPSSLSAAISISSAFRCRSFEFESFRLNFRDLIFCWFFFIHFVAVVIRFEVHDESLTLINTRNSHVIAVWLRLMFEQSQVMRNIERIADLLKTLFLDLVLTLIVDVK